MNILLTLGSLLIIGYIAGWLLDKGGIPKVIGYIATGIAFSPNTINFIDSHTILATEPLMEVCLTFIAFEVGGALKWSKIKKHEKEIISITILASLFPFILIVAGIFITGLLFPALIPFDTFTLLLLALLLGALASSTAPAATLAVIHQYKAKGKVTDTILGVAALDDVLGILLFSLTISFIFIFSGETPIGLHSHPMLNSLYEITAAIIIGTILGYVVDPMSNFFQIKGEGQWVVIIFALLIFCVGLSKTLQTDILLSSMTMGIVVVNRCRHQKIIFKIIERYTEDLIFLFFFILSGLHLDLSTLSQAAIPILLFVLLRVSGKILGANVGARIAGANRSIRKYVAGGLLPQAGIVIGLVLSIYRNPRFSNISELLLTIIIGATVIHELLGPLAAKYSLTKAKEIENTKKQADT